MVADVTVVREMHVRHYEAVSPDARPPRLCRATIDGRILADDGPLADLDVGFLAVELEVLRVATQNRSDADGDRPAQRDVALQRGARREYAAVADHALFAHDRVRTNPHSFTDLRVRADQRGRMDHGRHGGGHRSRTMAAMSASATTSPSTLATPRILHTRPRICVISTSKRSWSPGRTGRRNFTLSSDMKYTTLLSASVIPPMSSTPPSCAIASMISTPGMIGCPGKCPSKYGSLMVTFLMPTIRFPSSTSMIRSTNRNGYRCGITFINSSTIITCFGSFVASAMRRSCRPSVAPRAPVTAARPSSLPFAATVAARGAVPAACAALTISRTR